MIVAIITGVLGGFATYLCHTKTRLSAVQSSVFCSLCFVALTLLICTDANISNYYQVLFFGATFVGMSSSKNLNLPSICMASLLFSALYHCSFQHFNGIGGALGTSASITVIIVYLLQLLLKKTSG